MRALFSQQFCEWQTTRFSVNSVYIPANKYIGKLSGTNISNNIFLVGIGVVF